MSTINYEECRVGYIPGKTHVVCFIHPENDVTAYSGKSIEEMKEEYPGMQVYENMEAVYPLLEEAENKTYIGEFKEITEDQWWEMYECLPPLRTVRHDDGLFFCFLMSEYMTSNITGHYFQIQDRYFSAHRRDTDNVGDMYQEIMKKYFVNGNS
jgi:hypothetical protein